MAIRFVPDPVLDDDLREQIVTLWTAVTNAGGAVGFVAPVTTDDVRPVAEQAGPCAGSSGRLRRCRQVGCS
jgi:hypothetical protein